MRSISIPIATAAQLEVGKIPVLRYEQVVFTEEDLGTLDDAILDIELEYVQGHSTKLKEFRRRFANLLTS